jgi:hypothetical protein
MSLPETGQVSVIGGNDEIPNAFLTKLPPSLWKALQNSTQTKDNFKISLDGGEFVSSPFHVIITEK